MPQWSTHRRLTSLIAAVIMNAIVVGGVVTPVRAQITENWRYQLTFRNQSGAVITVIETRTFELNAVPKDVDTLTVAADVGTFDSLAVGQTFAFALLELINGDTGQTMKAYQLSQLKVTATRLSGAPTAVNVTIAMSVKSVVALPSP